MPKEIEITVSRANLPGANSEFGLREEDFDLTKAKVWIDGVVVEPSSQRTKDLFVGKAKIADDRPPRTFVVTTEAGTPVAFLKGDKIRFKETLLAPPPSYAAGPSQSAAAAPPSYAAGPSQSAASTPPSDAAGTSQPAATARPGEGSGTGHSADDAPKKDAKKRRDRRSRRS
jgi:hypothetical protein